MPIRRFLALFFLLLLNLLTTGCATKRQIAVDYPVAKSTDLAPLQGYDAIDGDDYYVQVVSAFDFKGDSALKGGCNELGPKYESGNLSAALVFAVNNDKLKLRREASGFLYEATTGKCNFRLETKKALLTPWMRLDAGIDTTVGYHFFTSTSSEADFSKLIGDVNAASGLLALTGVGTGVAIMGNLASQWMLQNPTPAPSTKLPPSAKASDESHSLPTPIALSGKIVTLNSSRLAVYEVVESGSSVFGPEQKILGEINIYPMTTTSLLLKSSSSGLPDARDLSLAELWQSPIKTGNGDISLQQLISQIKTTEPINLKPVWANYAEVEGACLALKRTLKELGFNKFDRNAVLYYFLEQSRDWQQFNAPTMRTQPDDFSTAQLKNAHAKGFSACLTKSDYITMQHLGLPVNSEQDWGSILSSEQQKESTFNAIHAAERQLLSIIKNPNPAERSQQLYPLLATKNGAGTVLLQNHLGSFGLEALLQLPELAKEGAQVSAEQLNQVLGVLNIDRLSCVRPAPEQDKLLNNVGILLFSTKPGSAAVNGGALEFEVTAGKISRITLQLPSYRDFEQSLIDHPKIAGCQIEPNFFKAPTP
ncbi:MAG: hypothetical protein NTV00_02615 [Methylococcales bacterium]|nr:hypothetical protein [Methylococcales bacterium]